jgi:hypothetical protein
MPDHGQATATAACCQPDSPTFMGPTQAPSFWSDRAGWIRAGKNTFTCLVGCSIGDFGMLFFIQANYPETGIMWTMALAMSAGLLTSILLETVMLRTREGFDWANAVKTAFNMSFISMLAMELAATSTDFALTGGVFDPSTAWFWIALAISLVVGFATPLPYNYYMLKKHGHACH